MVESSVYMREPILLRWFNRGIDVLLSNLKLIVPALVGEIFEEEERILSARYEDILRALSSGKSTLSEAASMWYSNKIIEKQDVASIKPYIKSLIEMGLVRGVPELHGKRYNYFISSL